MLGTLENSFHGQKSFRLVGGSLSWSETPFFSKGGTPTNGARVAPECQNVRKKTFLAVQDSSIGDLVIQSVSEGVMF